MTSHIKLYGSKGERFETIKEGLTVRLGYEPSNPEVIGMLMANFDPTTIGLDRSANEKRMLEAGQYR